MTGLDNADSISADFDKNAKAVVIEAEDIKSAEFGAALSFKVPDALSQKDNLMNARTIIITEDENAYHKDPNSCPSLELDRNNVVIDGISFGGTAYLKINNMKSGLTQEIDNQNCFVVTEKSPSL